MDYDSVIIVALYTFGALMEMITLWYLCKIVLGESKRSPRETLVVFGITGVLALVLSMMDVTSNQRMLGFYIILLIPTMMFEGHILLKLFVCVAFFAIGGGSETLTKALMLAINADLTTFDIKVTWGRFAQGLIISKFLAFAVVRILASLQRVKHHQLSTLSVMAFSILPIATAMAINQLMKISYVIDSQQSYAMTFMIVALLVISNIVLFHILETQAENEQTKLRLALLQNQQNEQEKFYSQLAEEKTKTNRLAHDLNKYLLAISGYLQEDRHEDIEKCLTDLNINLQEAVCHYTSDMAIDTVITEKAQSAKAQDTFLRVTSFVQAPLMANGIDMALLLANALDNALEATADQPAAVIDLKLSIDEDYIDLIIKNPLTHAVKIVDNTIATTKADKAMHGLGLISIQEIVERYDGDLVLRNEAGHFIFDAMLMNREK